MFAYFQHGVPEPEVVISHHLYHIGGPCKRLKFVHMTLRRHVNKSKVFLQLSMHEIQLDCCKPELVRFN